MACRVRLLTDSAADLPQSYVDRYGIGVVPISVSLNGHTHVDDGTLDRSWFYRELVDTPAMPQTSAPSPQDFAQVYAGLVSEGAEEIVAITVAASVSSLHEHALLAARGFGGARVHVVDGMQISMGLGWLVICAAELASSGASAQEVVQYAIALRSRTRILGVIDAVDYLRRSGRVGWISSSVADLLMIKPLICFIEGQALQLGRVRTLKRGVQAMVGHARGLLPVERMAIIHSGAAPTLLAHLQETFAALLPDLKIPVLGVGPAFASHVGPGCVGVAVVEST